MAVASQVAKEPKKKSGGQTLYDVEQVLSTSIEEYHPKIVPVIQRMAAFGMTEREIAKFLDINPNTLRKWTLVHEELSRALKAGREISDDRVEASMFQQAVGYTIEEEKLFVVDKVVERHVVTTYIKPSTTAQIFWLKNRRPDAWKDVQKHEHGAAGEFDNLSDEEIAARLARVIGQDGPPDQQSQPAAGIRRKRGDSLN